MDVLKLPIPPMPMFLTVGHAVWKAGGRHFKRNFEVYDMLFVVKGTLYMTEEERPFAVKGGELLVLEPGKSHWGHKECSEATEIYWVHFKHDPPAELIDRRDIPWSSVLRQGTDFDQSPDEQAMYVPKYGTVDMTVLAPVLDDMVAIKRSLCHENAVLLHAHIGRLLALLQGGLKSPKASRSYLLCEQIKSYMGSRLAEPFRAERLEEALHFDFDYAARCLKKHTGMSPLQYLQFIRMEEAKRLLHHSVLPVQEIAERVGFGNYNYFIRSFRRTVGVAPGAYRLSQQRFI
jgi:AraC-like DNA-binding protein/mannose-6-phosphate isomerase-like protein (cupin superfamily)